MLCCGAADSEEKEKSREVDKALKASRALEKKKVKLLLLGAGESGKSTVFKQMKILYGTKATPEERKEYTKVVYGNIIQAVKLIVAQAETWSMRAKFADSSWLDTIAALVDEAPIDEDVGTTIERIWADPACHEIWDRRTEFQVVDSMKYFFENMARVKDTDYLATSEDFLYTRVRTTGVVTNSYDIEGTRFEMYDVGGQRNERRKWIHCFDNVTAVIFVAALSEYDQVLFESADTNRVVEALNLFEEICVMDYFKESAIILFLNKNDLFIDKIAKSPISNVDLWSDYTGGANLEAAHEYFLKKFLARNPNKDRNIFMHYTTATSSSNISTVFEACRAVILEQNIQDSGF